MFYKCSDCSYEFEVKIPEHPHNMYSRISVGAYGCPVCLKAASSPRVCPKCNSVNTMLKL